MQISKNNKVSVDGNGNIILQDVNGQNIVINDIEAMRRVMETFEPKFLKEISEQIKCISDANKELANKIIQLIENQTEKKKAKTDTEELKRLLETNDFDLLFDKLETLAADNNTFTLLKSQWNDFEQNKMLGVLSFDQERLFLNKLRLQILNFINSLEK